MEMLEKQLLEAGNKLLSPPSLASDLLESLNLVESFLLKVEHSPSESMRKALAPSTKALIAEELLRHSDTDVKVAVASCIIEITRITAPEAPYTDDEMKEVFHLIVSSFEKLDDKSSRSYSKSVSILETLASLRTCVVMLDLECDDLVVEMFRHFLRTIREDHNERVFTSMETIMTLTLVLEESKAISVDLLSSILNILKKEDKEVLSIARRLGENVIVNCASMVKPYLLSAVRSSGASLDNYSKAVADICQTGDEAVEPTDDVTNKNSKTVSIPKPTPKATKDVSGMEEAAKLSSKKKLPRKEQFCYFLQEQEETTKQTNLLLQQKDLLEQKLHAAEVDEFQKVMEMLTQQLQSFEKAVDKNDATLKQKEELILHFNSVLVNAKESLRAAQYKHESVSQIFGHLRKILYRNDQGCRDIPQHVAEELILPHLSEFVVHMEGGLGIWNANSITKFFPPSCFVGRIEKLVGSSAGIICLLCSLVQYFVVLINPLTGRYKKIWLQGKEYPNIGFWGTKDNLKIVRLRDVKGLRQIHVYSVNNGLWKRGVQKLQLGTIKDDSGVLVGDLICWQQIGPVRQVVIRYNVVDESWEPSVDLEIIGDVLHLRNFEGCLCATALGDDEIFVYLLKESAWYPLVRYRSSEVVPLPLAFPISYYGKGLLLAFRVYGCLAYYLWEEHEHQPRLVHLEADFQSYAIDIMQVSTTKIKAGMKIGKLGEQVRYFNPKPGSLPLKQIRFILFRII